MVTIVSPPGVDRVVPPVRPLTGAWATLGAGRRLEP